MLNYFHPSQNCYPIILDQLLTELHADYNPNKINKHDILEISLKPAEKLLTIKIINPTKLSHNTLTDNWPIYIYDNNCAGYTLNILGSADTKAVIIQLQQQLTATTIICEQNSTIDHYLIQQNNNATINIEQQGYSEFNATLLATRTDNSNLDLTVKLLEQYAKTNINILQQPTITSIHAIQLSIQHLASNTSSNTLARILATNKATASLTGRIIVAKGCSKANANLQSKALFLDPQANIVNRPELVIDHDDVVCAHGASIGQLDPVALFYLQARGIPIQTAIELLLDAFKQPILARIQYPEIIKIHT